MLRKIFVGKWTIFNITFSLVLVGVFWTNVELFGKCIIVSVNEKEKVQRTRLIPDEKAVAMVATNEPQTTMKLVK